MVTVHKTSILWLNNYNVKSKKTEIKREHLCVCSGI